MNLRVGQSIQISGTGEKPINGIVDFLDEETGYASVCISRGDHRSQDVKVVVGLGDYEKIINDEIK